MCRPPTLAGITPAVTDPRGVPQTPLHPTEVVAHLSRVLPDDPEACVFYLVSDALGRGRDRVRWGWGLRTDVQLCVCVGQSILDLRELLNIFFTIFVTLD